MGAPRVRGSPQPSPCLSTTHRSKSGDADGRSDRADRTGGRMGAPGGRTVGGEEEPPAVRRERRCEVVRQPREGRHLRLAPPPGPEVRDEEDEKGTGGGRGRAPGEADGAAVRAEGRSIFVGGGREHAGGDQLGAIARARPLRAPLGLGAGETDGTGAEQGDAGSRDGRGDCRQEARGAHAHLYASPPGRLRLCNRYW